MSTRSVFRIWVVALVVAAGCSDDPTEAIDAATDGRTADAATDGAAIDAPAIDAPSIDARIDAPAIDAMIDAPAIDAMIDAPGPDAVDADVSNCTIDGVFSALLEGSFSIFFGFHAATGSWEAATSASDLPTQPLLTGLFTFSNGTFTIQDDSCGTGVTGQYAVTFTAGCGFTLATINEPCSERADSLNGAPFTPVP